MKETKEANSAAERSRKGRSPNYPAISLPDAISRAELVYKKEHTHPAPPEVIAKAMGYSGLSGKSLTVVSALKKYGLLEETDSGLKISQDGLRILVGTKTSPERSDSIRKAAKAPQLFAELMDRFGDSLPSDDNLRSHLLLKNFLPGTVDGAIRAYRETVEYTLNEAGGRIVSEQAAEPKQTEDAFKDAFRAVAEDTKPMAHSKNASVVDELVYRLSRDCSARVSFDGPVTIKKIDKLIALLELNKDVYPDDEDGLL